MPCLFLLLISFIGCEPAPVEPEPDPKPVAQFLISSSEVTVGDEVNFTNLSENATSYLWEFGDSLNTTDEDPTHQYAQEGTFTVSLTAQKETESDQTSQTITVAPFPGQVETLKTGEKAEFFFLKTLDFRPTSVKIDYQGEGGAYLSKTGFTFLGVIQTSSGYLCSASFDYEADESTPAGFYQGTMKATFTNGSKSQPLSKSVLFIISH